MKALKWQILDEYNRIRDLESRYRLNPIRQFQTHFLMEKSKSKLERLTKLYKPRNNKFINHIIAQYNRGCICYPIEESEFDELPKCMYKFTMFGDTNWERNRGPYPFSKLYAVPAPDESYPIWLEANKYKEPHAKTPQTQEADKS